MPRIRTIKPEFPHSESMGRISRDARLTFILLWTIADDSGRLRGNSRMLASLLFPYDADAPKLIDRWLNELQQENCVVRYRVNGNQYIEIRNWLSHQKIDKPSKSKIEPFENGIEDSPNPREGSSGEWTKDQGPRTKDRKGAEDELPPLPTILDCEPFKTALGNWLSYKGKGHYKPQGLSALVSRAANLSAKHGVPAVCDAIERAMANGWKGWDQESSFANIPENISRAATREDDNNWNAVDGGLGARS